MAFFMAGSPSNILYLLPTDLDARVFSTTRLDQMIKDSPCLREIITSRYKKDSGETQHHKRYRGGSLELASAQSISKLRGRSVRVVLLDEVDAYKVTDEGHPCDLAEKRASAFWNRKVIYASTPTDESTSRIWFEFLNGDQRYYYVPCPYCSTSQILRTEQFKCTDKDPRTVHYECLNCKRWIPEAEKYNMLTRGKWIATNPTATYPSFHLAAFYSPFRSWSDIMAEWFAIKGDRFLLRVFSNTVEAMPWRDNANKTTLDDLKTRRGQYQRGQIPNGVGVLTCGVDVQGDRLEMSLWGYGHGLECWLIDYDQILMSPSLDETWTHLTNYLTRQYKAPNGATMLIGGVAIDAGHMMDTVCTYTRNYAHPNVIAVRGASNADAHFLSDMRTTKDKGLAYFNVGVSGAKVEIYSCLMNPDGPRSFHFPLDVSDEMLEQILSEKIVIKYVHNRPTQIWEKINERARNELLDTMIYSRAALRRLNCYDKLRELAEQYAGAEMPLPVLPVSQSVSLVTAAPRPPRQMRPIQFTYRNRPKFGPF